MPLSDVFLHAPMDRNGTEDLYTSLISECEQLMKLSPHLQALFPKGEKSGSAAMDESDSKDLLHVLVLLFHPEIEERLQKVHGGPSHAHGKGAELV